MTRYTLKLLRWRKEDGSTTGVARRTRHTSSQTSHVTAVAAHANIRQNVYAGRFSRVLDMMRVNTFTSLTLYFSTRAWVPICRYRLFTAAKREYIMFERLGYLMAIAAGAARLRAHRLGRRMPTVDEYDGWGHAILASRYDIAKRPGRADFRARIYFLSRDEYYIRWLLLSWCRWWALRRDMKLPSQAEPSA